MPRSTLSACVCWHKDPTCNIRGLHDHLLYQEIFNKMYFLWAFGSQVRLPIGLVKLERNSVSNQQSWTVLTSHLDVLDSQTTSYQCGSAGGLHTSACWVSVQDPEIMCRSATIPFFHSITQYLKTTMIARVSKWEKGKTAEWSEHQPNIREPAWNPLSACLVWGQGRCCVFLWLFPTCKLQLIPSPNPQQHSAGKYTRECRLLSHRSNGIMVVPKTDSIPDDLIFRKHPLCRKW